MKNGVKESEIFVIDLYSDKFEQPNLLIDELSLNLINTLIKESENFLANNVLKN